MTLRSTSGTIGSYEITGLDLTTCGRYEIEGILNLINIQSISFNVTKIRVDNNISSLNL